MSEHHLRPAPTASVHVLSLAAAMLGGLGANFGPVFRSGKKPKRVYGEPVDFRSRCLDFLAKCKSPHWTGLLRHRLTGQRREAGVLKSCIWFAANAVEDEEGFTRYRQVWRRSFRKAWEWLQHAEPINLQTEPAGGAT